jgi:hypothetical protein
VGLVSGVALSLSGMMGSGLFSILGHAYLVDGTRVPLAFMLASVAILFSVYAISKLAARFPGPGGPARFALVCFGPGLLSGWINLFLYLCFLLATALYAAGFSAYIGVLTGPMLTAEQLKVLGATLVVLCTLVNLLGANRVGRVASVLITLVFCALQFAIDTRLFNRNHRAIALTDSGSRLYADVADGFARILERRASRRTDRATRCGTHRRGTMRACRTAAPLLSRRP